MVVYKQGQLNIAQDDVPTALFVQDWTQDTLGNWDTFNNNGVTDVRTHDSMNQITSGGITHDDTGNMTSDGSNNYEFDALNRLIKATVGGVVTEYSYDALGRRIQKDVGGVVTNFVCDGMQVIEEQDSFGALVKDYVYGSMFIDEVVALGVGSIDYFYLEDYRFSVLALSDSSGNIVERYSYTPFGERIVTDASYFVLGASAFGNNYGFTGRYHDSETGIMYFRARYYSRLLGRFLSRDPLGFVDGMGLHRGYFGVNGVDPSGLLEWDFDEKTKTLTLKVKVDMSFGLGTLSPSEWKKERRERFKKRFVKAIYKKWNNSGFRAVPKKKKYTKKIFKKVTHLVPGNRHPFYTFKQNGTKTGNCPCSTEGFDLKVKLEYSKGGIGFADWKVMILASTGDKTIVSKTSPNMAPKINPRNGIVNNTGTNNGGESLVTVIQAHSWVDTNSDSLQQKNDNSLIGGYHSSAAHEFGHILGIEHPGVAAGQLKYSEDKDPNASWTYNYTGNGYIGHEELMGAGEGMRADYFTVWKNYLNENYPCDYEIVKGPKL